MTQDLPRTARGSADGSTAGAAAGPAGRRARKPPSSDYNAESIQEVHQHLFVLFEILHQKSRRNVGTYIFHTHGNYRQSEWRVLW